MKLKYELDNFKDSNGNGIGENVPKLIQNLNNFKSDLLKNFLEDQSKNQENKIMLDEFYRK